MKAIGLLSRLLLVGFVLTAALAATGVVAAEADAGGNETDHNGSENGTDHGGGHEKTSVATDDTVSGFTLGAGLLAVLLGGTYQLFRD